GDHHLSLSGGKLSASRGGAPTSDEGIDRVGLDPLRHALCALGPETADVELAWDKVAELTASGLLGAVAGPPHRVATLLWRRFDGRPDPAALAGAGAEQAEAAAALAEVGAAIDRAELRRALHAVHALGRTVNRRLAATEPWRLPDPEAHRELTRLLPLLDALGVAAWPFVPGTAGRVHIDPPPPEVLEDLDALKAADRFRVANHLRAWIEVDDGRIGDYGHAGGGQIGSTTLRLGARDLTFAAMAFPDLRPKPEIGD